SACPGVPRDASMHYTLQHPVDRLPLIAVQRRLDAALVLPLLLVLSRTDKPRWGEIHHQLAAPLITPGGEQLHQVVAHSTHARRQLILVDTEPALLHVCRASTDWPVECKLDV